MKTITRFERGQALIIIVFGMIALIGLTALSIDGGMVYADRRHAQNAADTAVLAAALAKVKGEDWKPVGDGRAVSNGYPDTDTTSSTTSSTSNVEIYSCDEAASSCGQYAGSNEYVQTIITSHVRTYFAPIVGVRELVNRVSAVAHAKPTEVKPWFEGNAVVSLMPGCKPPGWPSDPFTISGNSTSIVGGSGVLVNSNCNNAITQNGGASMTVNDGFSICSNGEPSLANYAPGSINPPPTDCNGQQDPNAMLYPNIDCGTDNGSISMINPSPKVYEATPGNYYGGFPNVSPSGTLILDKGIYCIHGGDFDLHSSWVITTDRNNDGNPGNDSNEGVLFYLPDGGVTLNGSSSVTINAMYTSDVPAGLRGILIYLPPGNSSTVTLNGSSGSEFTGTILAPSSLISLEGVHTSYDVNSQLIGYSLKTSGSASIHIYYDQSLNNLATYKPLIQLTK